jgi:thioredoxin reductase (NADPH)
MAETLIGNLLEQIKPFHPKFVLEERVIECNHHQQQNHFTLTTHLGTRFNTRAVVIASGAGAMAPVPLRVPGVDAFLNTHIFYGVRDPHIHKNKRIAILGGGDSAFDWATELQKEAKEVVLIHRSQRFRAATTSVNQFFKLCDNFQAQFLQGQVNDIWVEHGDFRGLKVTGADHVVRSLPVDHVVVCFGMVPDPSNVSGWDVQKQRFECIVSTETFETSQPGIYAIGDCNTYPGKKKLILSGFHEAALAAFAIKEQLTPDQKIRLEYTTTSNRILTRLGVREEDR